MLPARAGIGLALLGVRPSDPLGDPIWVVRHGPTSYLVLYGLMGQSPGLDLLLFQNLGEDPDLLGSGLDEGGDIYVVHLKRLGGGLCCFLTFQVHDGS